MAKPAHVGNEKYLADFWIIEASYLDVDELDRSPPAYQEVLKDIREAVSDQG